MIALTRRYRFPAAHVLSCSSFSSEENEDDYDGEDDDIDHDMQW